MNTLLKPRWQTAVLMTVVFAAIQFLGGRLFDLDMETAFDSADSVWTGLTFRVGLTAMIVTVIGLWARKAWNGGVYDQTESLPDKPPLPRWMWIIPISVFLLTTAKIVVRDWGFYESAASSIMALAIGVVFVGISIYALVVMHRRDKQADQSSRKPPRRLDVTPPGVGQRGPPA